MYRGYKIRIYPTKEQENTLINHINACRFFWNYLLEIQNKSYKETKKVLNYNALSKEVVKIKSKEEYSWIKEISSSSLQRVANDLCDGYKRFFNGQNKRTPKFKTKRHSKQSYPPCQAKGRFYFEDEYVQIQNIGKIKYKTKYNIPNGKEISFSNPRITYENNKWILSFSIECENQTQHNVSNNNMGIDLGIKNLAIVSFGDEKYVFRNINKDQRVVKLNKKLKHIKRVISRKYRQHGNYIKTNNIIKYEKIQKSIYNKITNIRKNYIHQTTSFLISLNPNKIVIEDLNISGMLKNRHLRAKILEQNWGEFIRQIEYKTEYNNIQLVKANRFYPSSKTCSKCGNVKKILKLSERTYVCEKCGLKIDRDYNASINLMNYNE